MAQGDCHDCPGLDIAMWSRGSDNITYEHATHPSIVVSLEFDVAIIFCQADKIRRCESCRAELTQAFVLPELWWTDYCRNSNGFFGCEDAVDERGAVSGIRTWCRFLVKQVSTAPDGASSYNWYKLNSFTTWLRSRGQTVVFVFDPPLSIQESLRRRLLNGLGGEQLSNPFWMYAGLVEEVVILQDRAVWAVRDLVRATEKNRTSPEMPRPDYVHLHDMARHAIHVSETLELGTNTVDGILAHHNRVVSLLGGGAGPGGAGASSLVGNRLLFYQDMLRSLRIRSAANKERLQNEIELAFNAVAQYDARVSVEIGRAAQADGAAMRTIAFATLTFLPPTFICAVFSMSFFDYDSGSGSWSVSGDFWRYWAVAAPVTVCTTALWFCWRWLFPPMVIGSTRRNRGDGGSALARMLKRPMTADDRKTSVLPALSA